MYRPHKPLHCRASLSQPYQQVGLAIGPPKPVLNLESKRLHGPDVPAPKAVRYPFREFAIFWAQFNALTQRISAVIAPAVAVVQRFELVYREEKARLSPRP